MTCLAVSVVFLLFCVLMIVDGLQLNRIAEKIIIVQAAAAQIKNAKNNSKAPKNITPEQLQ
ncbi:MAG TPA: hypothetical protein V6C65_11055 [Allocoleopsis sp.]